MHGYEFESKIIFYMVIYSFFISSDLRQVFREFYPVSDDYVTLECVWKSDKFVLLERKHNRETESQGEDSGGNLYVQTSSVAYNSIGSFLGGKNHDMLISVIPPSLGVHFYIYLFGGEFSS